MKKKIIAIGIVFFLFLAILAPLTQVQAIDKNIIPGKDKGKNIIVNESIYTELDGKGLIIQTPHTVNDFNNQVEIEFTSYYPTNQTLDIAFGFDTPYVSISKIEIWSNTSHPNEQPVYGLVTREVYFDNVISMEKINKSIANGSVDIGNINADNIYEVYLGTNTTYETKIIGFDFLLQSNDTCYTFFWDEYGISYWKEKWYDDWNEVNWNVGDLDSKKEPKKIKTVDLKKKPTFIPDIDKTWWVIDNILFENNQTKKMRITLDVAPILGEQTYKYDILVKQSDESFEKAFKSDNYILLDPWIMTNWNLRAPICINNVGCNTAQINFPVYMNLSWQTGMNASFEDIRIMNVTANTSVPYHTLNKSDGAWIQFRFNVSYLVQSAWTNDSYYLYWSNTLATNTSNATATYMFWDNGNGNDTGQMDLNKYEIAGVPPTSLSTNGTMTITVAGLGEFISKTKFENVTMVTRVINKGGTARIGLMTGQNIEYTVSEGNTWYTGISGNQSYSESIPGFNSSVFKEYRIKWLNYTSVQVYLDNDTLAINHTRVTKAVPNSTMGVCFGGITATNTLEYDWVYVYPLADPEPTALLGEVETKPFEYQLPPTPSNLQNTTGTWWVNYTWSAGFEGVEWQNDTAITRGLDKATLYSMPNAFELNGTHYIISGNTSGWQFGYKWNGTGWENNTDITYGINPITPKTYNWIDFTFFQINDTWYALGSSYYVIIEPYSKWIGYKWNGTGWENNTDIVNGLLSYGNTFVFAAVFEKNGTDYLVAGLTNGESYGYNWTGTTWQNDTAITIGLPIDGGTQVSPTTFYINSSLYLIYGEYNSNFYGYRWNYTNSSWNNYTKMETGLNKIGLYASPTVFDINSTYYLISGNKTGYFTGYNWTTNKTDSYNVLVTNNSVQTWYNGSSNTSINITALPFTWVNISVWGYNNIAGNISLSLITQNTQLIPSLMVWVKDEEDESFLNQFYTTIDVNNISKYSGYNYFTGYVSTEVGYVLDYELGVWKDNYTERQFQISIDEPTNLTVYLLKTANGAYINFHVSDGYGYAIPHVLVEAVLSNGTVESSYTDSSGTSRLFLNPLTTYTIRLSKLGYATLTYSIIPTSSNYYFVMTTQTSPEAPTEGTVWHFYPISTSIKNETITFMLNTSSIYGNIEYWNMKIENDTTVLFNETKTDAWGGSIITSLNLSEYQTGDELYVTLTLKETGKEPLILYPPYIVMHIYSEDIKETSLYRVISDLGDTMGGFAKNFIALTMALLFAGIVTKYSGAGAYGGGILSLIFLGIFVIFGWVDGWLMALVGVCAFGAFALMRGGGV